ncbi:TIR domain-containing protein [Singulisphaera sp. GP187]|uniref:AbiJ-related protein n=1 Tax=Singulisphaera sp. GP187 TaxID=1882752 RepID=UPI000927D276|nr:TIR domain-containing protein [Singulisphaera sp. GP187]SIN75691.1 TIR domain-containing protein [Singulisphaera sp. GP187]
MDEGPEYAISYSTRRDIFDALKFDNHCWSGQLPDAAFLSRIYNLNLLPSSDHRHPTAAGDIVRHREWNDDWPDDWILTDDRFDLLNVSDATFLRFLTEMVHPLVQPDPKVSTAIVEILNGYLHDSGWAFIRKREIAGKPIFEAQRFPDSVLPTNIPPPSPSQEQRATFIPTATFTPSLQPAEPVPTPSAPTQSRTKVFVSYSHQDIDWMKRLRVHLAPLERDGKVDRWDDTRIRTSQLWREEIHKAIDATKVAVLLVSADFLASTFIADNELPPLLAAAKYDGAFIMPVIVSPCRFSATPVLSDFQAVNSPSQPLVALRRARREALWVKLTNDIEDALSGKLH